MLAIYLEVKVKRETPDKSLHLLKSKRKLRKLSQKKDIKKVNAFLK